MIRDRPSIADPERAFRVAYNASGATILRGYPVCLDIATLDGKPRITTPLTAGSMSNLSLFYGVAFEDILSGAEGRIQRDGYCDYALVANHPSTNTVIGDLLLCLTGQTYLQRGAAGAAAPSYLGGAFSLEVIIANATITPVVRKIWLRV
jgi:hypothetical protein